VDFRFETDVRVRFAETDAQGVAHNSNYLVWFEIARIDYLERHAGGCQRLRDLGIEPFLPESSPSDACRRFEWGEDPEEAPSLRTNL